MGTLLIACSLAFLLAAFMFFIEEKSRIFSTGILCLLSIALATIFMYDFEESYVLSCMAKEGCIASLTIKYDSEHEARMMALEDNNDHYSK